MAPYYPMDLVAVRHGEAEGNRARRMEDQGDLRGHEILRNERHETNFRLTDLGRSQAAEAGKWLRTVYPGGFDAYHCSDTGRTRETAGCLALPGALWEIESLLRERDSREFLALTRVEQRRRWESLPGALRNAPYYFHALGEAPAELIDLRIRPMLARWAGLDLDAVVLATHGEWMRALRSHLFGHTKDEWEALYSERGCYNQVLPAAVHVYTRRNPECAADVRPCFGWFRSFCPSNPGDASNSDWQPIVRKRFSNEDLLASVAVYPQLVNNPVLGMSA
jgi:broad specificity phosphatase PhoE